MNWKLYCYESETECQNLSQGHVAAYESVPYNSLFAMFNFCYAGEAQTTRNWVVKHNLWHRISIQMLLYLPAKIASKTMIRPIATTISTIQHMTPQFTWIKTVSCCYNPLWAHKCTATDLCGVEKECNLPRPWTWGTYAPSNNSFRRDLGFGSKPHTALSRVSI